VPFISEKMIQRREQEGAKTPALLADCAQGVARDKLAEELLGEILRIVRTKTLRAHVAVKRKPISPAQPLQRLPCSRRRPPPRRQHYAPVRGGKDRWHLGWWIHGIRSPEIRSRASRTAR